MFDFLNRSKSAQASAAPAVKASATGAVVAMQTTGRVAWSPRDTVSLTRQGFSGNPIGFRAVKIIAEAAAALPLVVQDRQQRYDTHPVQDLIARPNMAQGRAELLEALYGQLLKLSPTRPCRWNCMCCAQTAWHSCPARMAGRWPMNTAWARARCAFR